LEAEPGGRIVVSAGHHHAGAGGVQALQDAAEQGITVGGGGGRVEDVAGHGDHVDLPVANDVDEGVEHDLQVVEGLVGVEGAPDVPVTRVQDLHDSHATVGHRQSRPEHRACTFSGHSGIFVYLCFG